MKAPQASRADRQRVVEAVERTMRHVANVDEHVFQHMRPEVLVEQIVPLTEHALRPLVDELTAVLLDENRRIADESYAQKAGVHKALKTKGDDDFVRKHVAKLVVDITAEQRRALKRVIARRLDRDSIRNDTLVKDIKHAVGLTERDANAVMNLRDTLESNNIPASRIDSQVSRYSAKLHKNRAQRIARTETVRIETHGRRAGWLQAQKDGHLKHAAVVEWIPDANACEECIALGNAAPVPLNGGTFNGPDGPISGPPAHPHCECDTAVKDKES